MHLNLCGILHRKVTVQGLRQCKGLCAVVVCL